MDKKIMLPQRWMDSLVMQIENIIEFAEENQLTNEQEFLDFVDKINKLSIKY